MVAVVLESDPLPEHDAQRANRTEDRAEREPGGQFPRRDAPPVPEPHLAQGERADDQRRGLRPGVAARADDQRDEQREHHRLGNLDLEVADRRCREHLAEEQRRQPPGPFAQHRHEAHLHVRLVQRFHAAELLGVFGLLLLDHVDHVVHGHDTDHAFVVIHDRDRHEVVLRREPGDFLAVGVRVHVTHLGMHHVGDRRAGRRGEQFLERHHAANLPGNVGHVDRVQHLLPPIAGNGADLRQGLVRRQRLIDGDELRRHQPAGGVRIEREQRLGRAPLVLRHLVEDALGVLLVQLLEHVGALVRRHLADEFGRVLGAHRLEHFGPQLLLQVLKDFCGALGAQCAEQRRDAVARQRLDDVGEVGRMEVRRFAGDVRRGFVEQRQDVGGEEGPDRMLVRVPVRHGASSRSRADAVHEGWSPGVKLPARFRGNKRRANHFLKHAVECGTYSVHSSGRCAPCESPDRRPHATTDPDSRCVAPPSSS